MCLNGEKSTCLEVHDFAFLSSGMLDVVTELVGFVHGHLGEAFLELVDGGSPGVHFGVELVGTEAKN